MTDSKALKEIIQKSGLKYGHIAKQIGLSSAGLYMKINNKISFYAKEVDGLCEILGLNVEQRMKIFFAKDVNEKVTKSDK